MKINFKEERKVYWIFACIIFNITRLITPIFRTKKIWVFGAQTGTKYDDNSMYLFEYVNAVDPDIRSVWLTRKDEVVDQVRAKGYEAYKVDSFKGVQIALRTKIVFYTAGLSDFGTLPLVGGAKIISLWHGVGFKRIYNETYFGISAKIKKIMDLFFSWTYRNISIATSDYSLKKTARQFGQKEKDIYITGQPRNDVFKTDIAYRDVFKNINIPQDRKILLYMPTYRRSVEKGDVVLSIIQELRENSLLNEFLEREKIVFVAKLHPKTKIDKLDSNNRFVILRDENVFSNQKLVAISDIMLTDYSSCFIDFALLNRAIFFYTPDIDQYMENAGGMDEEFFDLTSTNRSTSIEELCGYLKNWANPKILEQTRIVNEWFEDESIVDTSYCENVYKVISNIAKIRTN